MAVVDRLERIGRLVDRIRNYNRLVLEDSLEPTTLEDLKGNVEDLCDEIKVEADQIKTEVGHWV